MSTQDKTTRNERPRRAQPLWVKVGLGGAALVTMGLLAAARVDRDPPEAAPTARLLPVRSMAVEARDHYEVVGRFVGRVEAARSSELGFELAGTVVGMAVEEGDEVQEGELLANLDTARLRAQRTELHAAMAEAEAGERLAASTLERFRRVAGSAVSRQRIDEVEQELSTARAIVKRINAQLDAIAVSFTKSDLRAPYAGVVVERLVDEGSVASPGRTIYRLLEVERLEVRAGLTPAAADTLSEGQTVELTGPGHRCHPASVARILPERSESTRTVDVIFTVLAGSTGLRDGDLIEVSVPRTVPSRGFWLARSALAESVRGLWAAYVLVPSKTEAASRLERRQIEILHQEGERLFVRGALANGDRVVIGGLHRLVPGQLVRESPARETVRR